MSGKVLALPRAAGQQPNLALLACAAGAQTERMVQRLREWPPATWLVIYVGSVFVLMGSVRTHLLPIGAGLIMLGLGVGLYLATARDGRPRPPWLLLGLGGVAVFYVVCAIVATQLGPEFAAAAFAAGAIPLAATAFSIATVRSHTKVTEDGHLKDESAEAQTPYPVLGLDDERPLGDSPEVHGDISPHDLPKDSPARDAVEREARHSGGRTSGVPAGEQRRDR
jgi:hypothetical protein